MVRSIQHFFFVYLFVFSLSTLMASSGPKKEGDQIQAVVFVPSKEALLQADELENLKGFYSCGVTLPTREKKLTQILQEKTFGQPFTEEVYTQTEKALSKYFYKNNDPFVVVTIPDQDPSSGVLQVIIIHAKIGKITYEGNRWTSDRKLKRCFAVKPGDEINLSSLDRSLYTLNRNPFRRVDLIYSPGEEAGTTDLTMRVEDKKPVRIYAGVNNSGVSTTDRQRWLAGATFGNLWGLDHIFSLQYLASYTPKNFQAISAQYIAPFDWGHALNIYGGYSTVHADLPFPSMSSTGASYQSSLRYAIPYSTRANHIGEGYFGFDIKGTNNTLEYSELFLNFSNTVNLTQFVVGANQTIQKPTFRLDLSGELDWSPGRMIANQSNDDYESLRPGAKNHWLVARASFAYLQEIIKQLKSYLYLRGQLSSQNLLPSEQIGLGGFDTVRGYTERQLNYDSGFLGTGELHFLNFSLARRFFNCKLPDEGYFIAFIDYGYGNNRTPLPGEPSSDYLLGIGPGIRYKLPPYLIASFDWGIKLHQSVEFIGGGSMVYFSLLLNY